MNSRKKYGAAGHYFHSCANKETTDHYLQSRCANKNPRATIRTAALPIRIHVSLIGVAIRTAALRIICLMLLIRTAALCTVITHSLLCRAADNQSQYLIYIT